MPAERLDEPGSHARIEEEPDREGREVRVTTDEMVGLENRAYREDAAVGPTGARAGELSASSDESREAAGGISGWVDVPNASVGFDPAGSPTPGTAGVAQHSAGPSHGGAEAPDQEQAPPEAGPWRPELGDALESASEPGPASDDALSEWEASPAASSSGVELTGEDGSQSQEGTAQAGPTTVGQTSLAAERDRNTSEGTAQAGPTTVGQTSLEERDRNTSEGTAQAGPTTVGQTSLEERDRNGQEDHLASDEEGSDATPAAWPAKGRGPRIQQLEREGEVAADFLERLLDIADLDGDIDVDVDGDRAAVAIVDSEEGRVPRRLVGPDGRVLEALQELTRLAVQTATGERSRLMLDVAGFRAERRSSLLQLARTAIAEVRDSGQQKALPNMTAFERKVVHDEVTAAGLVSESEGVDPHRHIVIMPA